MEVINKLTNEDWIRFDLYWLVKKEELERVVWNCKGTFGKDVPPFPLDIHAQEMLVRTMEWQREKEYELMGVPEKYMGKNKN